METGAKTKVVGGEKAQTKTTSSMGADVAMNAAPGKKSIMYIGWDSRVQAVWLGLPFTFKRGEAKEIPAAMAAALLKQPDKFTDKLDTKLDVRTDGGK